MKAVEIREPGGPDVLQLTTRPDPSPGAKQILIKVAAAGVNRPDVLQRMGAYPPPPGASDLPGLEVAGTVTALGAGATRFRLGDQVCALLTGGGYAELAVADEGSAMPVPAGLSLQEAAGLPETYLTVWANVFDDAGLRAGETLLVHGGTSGIGVTAIALAREAGARVIATASSAAKLDAIRALGADLALDYTADDWEKQIAAAGGADVVLDMTGGDFVARNLDCLNPGGRHVSIAFLRGAVAPINIFAVMRKRLRLTGSTLKARDAEEKARLVDGLVARFWPALAAGRARPVLDRTFPFAAAAEAHRRMERGEHVGKILLLPE
jgi:putative PIG3 family NAD(P)H quinone oxidoreductase